MLWLLFGGKFRKTLETPKLFDIFPESDNSKMFKFITCGIIFLLLSLGGLGCVGTIATIGGGFAEPAAPTTPASVPTPNIRTR